MRSNALFSFKKGLFSTFLNSVSSARMRAAPPRRSFIISVFWLFCAVAACFQPPTLRAESLQHFTSDEFDLSFDYSTDLEAVKVDLPQAVVALRGKSGGYPTFNILVAAETFDPAQLTEQSYKEKILSDYRAVGISDAKHVRTYASPVSGMSVYTTELRYQNKEQVILAAVTIVPAGENKRFILTYMDLADSFYRRKLAREEIANSLKINSSALPSGAESKALAESPGYWVKLLFFALAGLIAVGALFKLRTKS